LIKRNQRYSGIFLKKNVKIMKRIAGFFLVAVMGGFSAIGLQNLITKNNPTSTEQLVSDNRTFPVRYTNYPDNPVSGSNIDFTVAAEMTVNTVVHVKTVTTSTTEYFDPFHYFFRGEPQRRQQTQTSTGSGVIISRDGYIVTNNHVIANAEKIEITLNNNVTYNAKIIGTDPTTDLALIKIDAKDLPYITFGNSDNVKVGEWALAVGNPFNLTSTVTAGIISAKGRSINILEGDDKKGIFPIESFIQTDAAVNPGNSGGALVNINGELIGINTAIASGTGFFAGYSFAIPVNIVKKISSDLLEFGEVQRAFLGVRITDIDSKFAEENEIKEMRGIYVAGITDGGSAQDAGLREGDIIIRIGDKKVNTVPELQEQISNYRPGDKINVTVNRKGAEKTVNVTLKGLNGNTTVSKSEKTPEFSALGATFDIVPKDEKKNLKIEGGAKIIRVGPGKLQAAGVREGFIVTRIDKKEIKTPEDVTKAIDSLRGGVLIEGIYPNGMRAYYGFGL
jgi:serine protease Do